MGGQPKIAAENGDKGVEGGIEDGGLEVGRDEGKNDDGRSGQEVNGGAMAGGEDNGEETRSESNPEDAFVHISDGWPAGDADASDETSDEKEKAEPSEEGANGEKTRILFLARGKENQGGKKPKDPREAERMIFEISDFELDFCARKRGAALLSKQIGEGNGQPRGGPWGRFGRGRGRRNDAKGFARDKGGEKAKAEGDSLGGGGEVGNFGLGAGGTGSIGLAGEFGELRLGDEEARGEVAGLGRELESLAKGGVLDQDDGFIFPAGGFQPEGEDELAGADFTEVRQGDGGATGERSGEFLGKGEKGFEAAAMLEDKGVESGIIFGGNGYVLGEGGGAEERENERKDEAGHGLGSGGGFTAEVEHGKDAGDHEKRAAPF